MNTNIKLKANETGFWPKWFGKLLFTLISVKVWGLIACTSISTWLLMMNLTHKPVIVGDQIIEYGINGAQWVTFNTTIWALIFGMKEIFRISEQSDNSEQFILKEKLDSKERLTEILSSCDTCFDMEKTGPGFETVGTEPTEQ